MDKDSLTSKVNVVRIQAKRTQLTRVRSIYKPAPPTFISFCSDSLLALFYSRMGGYRDENVCREIIPSFLRHWLVSRTLVMSLGLICYVNSCLGDFVFDDSEAIINNKDIDPGASTIADVFSHDFWGNKISSKTSHKSYRPLTVLTFRLNFMMAGGRHPFHFHLTNVLLHPLVCLLLFEVLNSWFHQFKINCINQAVSKHTACKDTCSVAFIAALLFAVHPIHTESVSSSAVIIYLTFYIL